MFNSTQLPPIIMQLWKSELLVFNLQFELWKKKQRKVYVADVC